MDKAPSCWTTRSHDSPVSPSETGNPRKHSPWTANRQRKKNKQGHLPVCISEDEDIEEGCYAPNDACDEAIEGIVNMSMVSRRCKPLPETGSSLEWLSTLRKTAPEQYLFLPPSLRSTSISGPTMTSKPSRLSLPATGPLECSRASHTPEAARPSGQALIDASPHRRNSTGEIHPEDKSREVAANNARPPLLDVTPVLNAPLAVASSAPSLLAASVPLSRSQEDERNRASKRRSCQEMCLPTATAARQPALPSAATGLHQQQRGGSSTGSPMGEAAAAGPGRPLLPELAACAGSPAVTGARQRRRALISRPAGMLSQVQRPVLLGRASSLSALEAGLMTQAAAACTPSFASCLVQLPGAPSVLQDASFRGFPRPNNRLGGDDVCASNKTRRPSLPSGAAAVCVAVEVACLVSPADAVKLTPTGCFEATLLPGDQDAGEDGFRISSVLTCCSEMSLAGSNEKLVRRDRHRKAAAVAEQPRGAFRPAALFRQEEGGSAAASREGNDEKEWSDWEEELCMRGPRGIESCDRGSAGWSYRDDGEADAWEGHDGCASPAVMGLSARFRLHLDEVFETPPPTPDGSAGYSARAALMLASRRLAMRMAGIDRDDVSPDAEGGLGVIPVEQLTTLEEFNAHLTKAAKAGDRGRADRLWNELCSKGINPSMQTLNMLMRCFVKSWACPFEAERLAAQVSKAGGFSPNALTRQLLDSMHMRYEQLCG